MEKRSWQETELRIRRAVPSRELRNDAGAHPVRSGALPLQLPWSLFLLRLQPLDIGHQVCDPLLYLGIVSLADARKERTPHRHVRAAVRWRVRLSTNHRRHMCGRIFSGIVLCQCSQIRRRSLHCRRCRSVALAIRSMAHGAIAVEHLFTRIRWYVGDRNVPNLC